MNTEIERLRAQVEILRRELTDVEQTLYEKNRMLDALHYVWCDGGCPGGCHRYSDAPVDEQAVLRLEQEAVRLRRWYENAKGRIARGLTWDAALKDKVR